MHQQQQKVHLNGNERQGSEVVVSFGYTIAFIAGSNLFSSLKHFNSLDRKGFSYSSKHSCMVI